VRTLFPTLLLLPFVCRVAQQPLPPFRAGPNHLACNRIIDLATGNRKIVCATPFCLFGATINYKIMEWIFRINRLSENCTVTIQLDNTNEKLITAYTNSNIDIV